MKALLWQLRYSSHKVQVTCVQSALVHHLKRCSLVAVRTRGPSQACNSSGPGAPLKASHAFVPAETPGTAAAATVTVADAAAGSCL